MNRDEIQQQCHELALDIPTVAGAAQPALRIRARRAPAGEVLGESRFGGRPDLAPEAAWPSWDATNWFHGQIAYAKKTIDECFKGQGSPYWLDFIERINADLKTPVRPLAFVAQLNLADLDGYSLSLPLPSEGLLSFFYDLRTSPGDFDPTAQDAWRVLFTPPGTHLARRDDPFASEQRSPHDDRPEPDEAAMTFEQIWTLPDVIASRDTELASWTSAAYGALLEAARGELPNHQVTGAPTQVQGDMAWGCQLVSSGVYCGTSPTLTTAERAFHEREARQWRLLFQVDRDAETLGVSWGDAGLLYWWIREPDVLSRRFDLARGAYQCS